MPFWAVLGYQRPMRCWSSVQTNFHWDRQTNNTTRLSRYRTKFADSVNKPNDSPAFTIAISSNELHILHGHRNCFLYILQYFVIFMHWARGHKQIHVDDGSCCQYPQYTQPDSDACRRDVLFIKQKRAFQTCHKIYFSKTTSGKVHRVLKYGSLILHPGNLSQTSV